MIELKTIDEWNELLESSNDKTVFLLKHSTTCPISAEGHDEFTAFMTDHEQPEYQFAVVKVIESRPISNAIAEQTGVKHESPQLLIIKQKQVQWTASHWSITKRKIANALADL